MKKITDNKKMSVKQISEATGAPVTTVRDAINRIFPKIMRHGVTTYLDEMQVAAISKELKRAANSTSSRSVAVTEIEMKEKAAEVMAWLLAEREIMKPKAEFYDRVTNSRGAVEMSAVAKLLENIGRNKLFQKLRDMKILRHNNMPYQEYVNRGYFRVIEQEYEKSDGETMVNFKTLVMQKGIDFISKIVSERNE